MDGAMPLAVPLTQLLAKTQQDRVAAAWLALAQVPDPEVPALSVCDLGIVRDVQAGNGAGSGGGDGEGNGAVDGAVDGADHGGVHVVLTPTYSGCPATEVIADSIRAALLAAGLGPVQITHRLAPAWTTDWISAEGRAKLRADGIAPPDGVRPVGDSRAGSASISTVHIRPRNLNCPRCGSVQTERLSAFGSTACKAMHRCLACREPFEHFKPL